MHYARNLKHMVNSYSTLSLEELMSVAVEPRETVAEHITRLVPYSPGKPIEEVKRELGLTDVVKLASNENALGPSPLAIEAIKDAAGRVNLYPDASYHALREAVSSYLEIPGRSEGRR